MTKKELKNIPVINHMINSKLRQREELKELSTCTGSMELKERVQNSNIPDRTRISDKVVDLEAEINRDIDALIALKREATKLFDSLTGWQKLIMEFRYQECLSWKEIAEKCNYSMQSVFRIHGSAILKIFNDESK